MTLKEALNAAYVALGYYAGKHPGMERSCNEAAAVLEAQANVEEGWHYWRECHNCGHASASYLHCLHDGVASRCVKCDAELASGYAGECSCEFFNQPGQPQANVEEKKAARLERVWAVHYGNYSPSEVESIWATEELARAHCASLDGSMWEVSWFEVRYALVEASRESASKKEDAGT